MFAPASKALVSFNPHRLRRAGATLEGRPGARREAGFNPHRLRRAGATRVSVRVRFRPFVSFNPHRLRRAGATTGAAAGGTGPGVFQSSPAPKSRCYIKHTPGPFEAARFQSSPAPKSRCYLGLFQPAVFTVVSILTGSEEPVLPIGEHCAGRVGFQSSPAPKSRCYWAVGSLTFAPNPGFNPHRLRRAGATRPCNRTAPADLVSILTGSEEPVLRATPAGSAAQSRRAGVSILTGSEEPVLRGWLSSGP